MGEMSKIKIFVTDGQTDRRNNEFLMYPTFPKGWEQKVQ